MSSKKTSLDAATNRAKSRRHPVKTTSRSLVQASETQDTALLARELRKRKEISAAARLARSAVAILAGKDESPTEHLPSTSVPPVRSSRNSLDQPWRSPPRSYSDGNAARQLQFPLLRLSIASHNGPMLCWKRPTPRTPFSGSRRFCAQIDQSDLRCENFVD